MNVKKLFFSIIILLFTPYLFLQAQTHAPPYPIIFVHGLFSDDATWETTVDFLGGEPKIFDVCLNHDENRQTANIDYDVVAQGWRDYDYQTPSPTRIYVINFDTDIMVGHNNCKQSNQSAIYKQGKALKMMISEVLLLENTDKVVLVGHSMGGLAIREYLQRIENGSRKWWVEPSDEIGGHKVVKVVTIGTPHLGSNCLNIGLLLPWFLPDLWSEAVRDLRYDYSIITKAPRIEDDGVYLYGGYESRGELDDYYNRDINCNGNDNDYIQGINSNVVPGNYNESLPLPTNIEYLWIVSKIGWGGDYLVRDDRQYLYNIGDTINTNVIHTSETSDYPSIIRGLDEPEEPELAYVISKNSNIKGYVTYKKSYQFLDIDLYKVEIDSTGFLKVGVDANSLSGVGQIAILDSNQNVLIFKSTASMPTEIIYYTEPGVYYIKIRGIANGESYQYPYALTTEHKALKILEPEGGEIFYSSSTMNIEWKSKNISNINLQISTDNGITWEYIAVNIPATLEVYSWVITDIQSTECIIKIIDSSNEEIFDISDVFIIRKPPLTIISPNGGEDWSAKSTREIKWGISNSDNIKIEYSVDGGYNWSTIIESTPASTGVYNWLVPEILSQNCKVKISDVLSPAEFDVSDEVFTISQENRWSTDPTENNPICLEMLHQYGVKIVSDGNGGGIIVWGDYRNMMITPLKDQIYAQKINFKGVTQWTHSGVEIVTKDGIYHEYFIFDIVSDKNGGFIVVYEVYGDVFAQKINSSGTKEWGEGGINICNDAEKVHYIKAISDGVGGAIIVWTEEKETIYDIYTQKINSSGVVLWTTNGIRICNGEHHKFSPKIVSDCNGGAIITWIDRKNDNIRLYAQRINYEGTKLWSEEGVCVTETIYSNIFHYLFEFAENPYQTISDESSGAIITWKDKRFNNSERHHIFTQRINENGNILWETGGVLLGEKWNIPTNWGYCSNIQQVSDGNGGAIITYYSEPSPAIFAHYLNKDGIKIWGQEGVVIKHMQQHSWPIGGASIISDGYGGAIYLCSENTAVKFWDRRFKIFAAKVNKNGVLEWPIVDVRTVSASEVNDEGGNVSMIGDGYGGAVMAFTYFENTPGYGWHFDIYAAKVNANGILGGDDIPVPVELIMFMAITAENNVKLVWETTQEINNYGFYIERRKEEKEWTKIGFLEGQGNSSTKTEYMFVDKNVAVGKYKYRLKQIDIDGTFMYSKEIDVDVSFLPGEYELKQNYPNPFNPETKICYEVPQNSWVGIKVYNLLGQEIATLVNVEQDAGRYEVVFDGGDLPSGVYFVRMESGNFVKSIKMMLLK